MIDWNQVKSLRNDVGHDAFDEIIDLFLDEVDDIVTKLRTAPQMAELENDMHSLKGSALNLGFRTFSGLCQAGEKLSAEGNADKVNLPEIFNCFDQSKSTFMKDVSTAIHS